MSFCPRQHQLLAAGAVGGEGERGRERLGLQTEGSCRSAPPALSWAEKLPPGLEELLFIEHLLQEMEKNLEELKTQMQDLGVYFTIDENNQNEVIDRVFSELTQTVSKVKAEAEAKSKEIIDKANEKSRTIVRQAMENSVELRTQNSLVMKNLKSISDMIDVILDKASQ